MTDHQALRLLREQFGSDLVALASHFRTLAERRKAKADAKRRQAYGRWRQMIERCSDPTHIAYRNYGGRGIKVCDKWLDFDAYYADTGARPRPGLSLDRRDNERGYEPGNMRWATAAEQSANRRCSRG